ncbi:MAG: hypothetical protein HN704_18355 [Bacteroidetes bacterium]|jgi:hypothetical protein|nr:hypothetical protein [Bacteroidota bacterium]MBT7493566.1 hypothetical protein [Bacteroidota bacterium]
MIESAISIFKKLPETKSQVKQYAILMRIPVLNGEVEPLRFAARISALEQLLKALKSDHLIKDVILQEAEKYGSKSFEHGNAKFQIKEVGVKYDYTNCMDVDWEQLDSNVKFETDKKKQREIFLKSITPEMEVYGRDGTQLKPVVKTSTTQVTVILK